MNRFRFVLDKNHNIILVNALLNGYSLKLLLDTGASHTVIDITTLIINGYSYSDATSSVQIETAKGVADAQLFKVKNLTALGITKLDFEISAYDFLANGIMAKFDGVLGLDFFTNSKFCIDLNKFEITINS